MKRADVFLWTRNFLLVVLLAVLTSACRPYMKMNPPADSDKPLPVPNGDNSCWMHTAANMLAGAGYGTGTTVQARAVDIFADMNANYGVANGGWIDAALQWWLASANNTWTNNPYSVVAVYGNKTGIPWANANGAQDIGNSLRACNMVGLSTSRPTGHGGDNGHAITAWGDNIKTRNTITVNPASVRLTDSDNDNGGDVQVYTYDVYTNPNPGGPNDGNGWYFNYGIPHRFIKHIVTLTPTSGPSGPNNVLVTGSYKIHQSKRQQASDLHYRVGTDVNILTYATWLDWANFTPTIVESQPRRELTVDWDLSKAMVPYCTWVTITTEFVEPNWNSISYRDVYFTYPEGKGDKFPDLFWKMETPEIEKASTIPNVTGGYIIGGFDVYNPRVPEEPAVQYRFVHQYLYNQSPEVHTLLLRGTPGFEVRNVRFTHSYGVPAKQEAWQYKKWMTETAEVYKLDDSLEIRIPIDFRGRLPYPEGDRGTTEPIKNER